MTTLAELRDELRVATGHAAFTDIARRTMDELARHELAKLARWYITDGNSAPPKTKGWRAKWPSDPAWRRMTVEPVTSRPFGSKGRAGAIALLCRHGVELPNGTRQSIGKSTIYRWVEDVESPLEPRKEVTRNEPIPNEAGGLPLGAPREMSRQKEYGQIRTPVRRQGCADYNKCLSYAAKLQWGGFACDGCGGPAHE